MPNLLSPLQWLWSKQGDTAYGRLEDLAAHHPAWEVLQHERLQCLQHKHYPCYVFPGRGEETEIIVQRQLHGPIGRHIRQLIWMKGVSYRIALRGYRTSEEGIVADHGRSAYQLCYKVPAGEGPLHQVLEDFDIYRRAPRWTRKVEKIEPLGIEKTLAGE